MDSTAKQRVRNVGGWACVGAAAAAATDSTPVGVVLVAGLGGSLAWRFLDRRRAHRH